MNRRRARPVGDMLVALTAVFGIASTGVPTPSVAVPPGRQDGSTVVRTLPAALLQLRLNKPEPNGVIPTTVTTRNDIEYIRQQLLTTQNGADSRITTKAARLLLWLDIASARSDSERHDLIRRLPVSITESAPTDGRLGTVKEFVAGGKVRVSLFTPATFPPVSVAPALSERVSGPSPAEVAAGRECYYEGQPADCATEEEIEDAAIAAADLSYQVEIEQADCDAVSQEIAEYCSL